MRILILGSGVIGMTSAWYLARAGHEVTVVDRQPGPALETSYANAGMLSTGYSSPWAAPGVPRKAIGWLLAKHAPLAIRLTSDPAQYRWMLQLLRNCSQARYQLNKARMLRLSSHSRDCLADLRATTGIDYEGRQGGTLQVFRKQQQLDAAAKDMAVLAPKLPPMITVNLGTLAQATAVTSLAPCLAIPPSSAFLPTIKPVMFCKNSSGMPRWQASSTKCAPFCADSLNSTPLLARMATG